MNVRSQMVIVALLAVGLTMDATSQTQPFVHTYDFEKNADGWELQPGVWSRIALENGHALRGQGHGFARLTAHSGNVASLRFRFRLENPQSSLHANVLESFAAGHTRYFVSFGAEGVGITRQQGASFRHMGMADAQVAPNVFHEAHVMVGGGTIDVFLDKEGVVGVDDANPPPPGHVSFESLDNSVVYVDDVEVKIGSEPTPHPRAPRPPMAMPPGADVGPFIGGAHTGDITLGGNDVLTLSRGRYTVKEGEIHLRGRARLRIEQGAVLIFERGKSPLVHWGISLVDEASLEIDGGNVVPNGGLVRVDVFGRASVTVKDANPLIHFINAGDEAKVNIVNSRFVTHIGGSVQLEGRAFADIRDSKVGAIALFIPPESSFRATGLRTGTFANFDLQRDLRATGIGFSLRMKNVELVADTLGEGPYERGWIIFADENANARISDSTLRKLVVGLRGVGADCSVRGLRLNHSTNLTVGRVTVNNVKVTGQWGFAVRGTRRATFDDCEGLWLWLEDKAEVLLRRSTMNEFDPRHYTGTLTFEDSEWKMAGEIIEGNDFLIKGTVKMDKGVQESLSWSQSAVTRRFPVIVLNAANNPVPNTEITLRRGSKTVTATTDAKGEASVELRFTDEDYAQPYQLTTGEGRVVNVDFFTATPIVVSK